MAGLDRPLFLTGMMGSGKSTTGRLLAARLGVPFIDHDRRVERLYGESMTTMFAESEPRFREREAAALRSLVAEPGFGQVGVVIAMGGGTVVARENRETMLACGVVVLLDVPNGVLADRLTSAERTARPLLAGVVAGGPSPASALTTRLRELFDAREHAYLDRALRVDATCEAAQVVDRVLAALDAAGQSSDTEADTPTHSVVSS